MLQIPGSRTPLRNKILPQIHNLLFKSKRAEYQDLQKQIVNLRQENAQYSEQVKQLKTDPQRIEKEAREQFHYARPGEVIYVSPEPAPPAAAPVSHSASK